MTIRPRPGAETLQTNETCATRRDEKISGVRALVRSSQRVLIVDASSDALAFMAFALRRHGHAVVLADGIQSAVTRAFRNSTSSSRTSRSPTAPA